MRHYSTFGFEKKRIPLTSIREMIVSYVEKYIFSREMIGKFEVFPIFLRGLICKGGLICQILRYTDRTVIYHVEENVFIRVFCCALLCFAFC